MPIERPLSATQVIPFSLPSSYDFARELLSLKEIAELSSVSFSTARRWIDRDELPVVRIGHVIRIKRADYNSFIEEHTVRSQEEL